MEEPTFSHHNNHDYPAEQRESHWLPALRPDTDTSDAIDSSGEQDLTIPLNGTTTELHNVQIPEPPNGPRITTERGGPPDSDNEHEGQPDPAWGFKRADSAHMLDRAGRSSSFPTFTNIDEMASSILAPTQELGPQEDGIDFNALLNDTDTTMEAISEEIAQREQYDMPYETANGDTIGSSQSALETAETWFEEGVPLLPSASSFQATNPETEDHFPSNTFESVNNGNEDFAFLAESQNELIDDTTAPNLERKSTEDVLGVMHFPSRKKSQDFLEQFGIQPVSDHQEADAQNLITETTLLDPVTEDKEDSVWAAVLDDDEFLIEDADDLLPDSEPGSPSSFMASLKDGDAGLLNVSQDTPDFMDLLEQKPADAQAPSNPYAPHQPSTSSMTQLSPKAYSNIGITRPGLGPMGSFRNHVQQTPIIQRAESFADQAKGGYKSPYDLPMEISKPKKRPQTQRVASQPQGLPPPPRSSSMSSQKQLQSPFSPITATFGQHPSSVGSPLTAGNRIPSAPVSSSTTSAAAGATQTKKTSQSSFFVELPVIARSKPSPAPGRYTPSQSSMAPPPLPPASPPTQRQIQTQPVASPPQVSDPYAQFQLRPPEPVDPYANVASQHTSLPVPAPSANRYSPAPGATTGVPRPSISPRYSPAPPSQPPAGPGRYASQPVVTPAGQYGASQNLSQPVQPPPTSTASSYLPRTSSPLAYPGRPSGEQSNVSMPPPPLPRPTQNVQNTSLMQSPPRTGTPPVIPPPTGSLAFSPPKTSDVAGQPAFAPPRRSQTQSPGRQMYRPTVTAGSDSGNVRPASAYGQVPTIKGFTQLEQTSPARSIGRTRDVIPETDFEQPQDDTQEDPLQRWRGAPIFRFGFGGVIVSSFPKLTPRYKAGQVKPSIKSTAGEVRTRTSKDLSLLPDHVASFPGPLRGKNKKKDLLSWMSSRIAKLEHEAPTMLGPAQTLPDPRKCHDELILLWKIVRIFVEHDGAIDGKPEALKALNIILSPEVHAIDESTASQYRADTDISGIYRPAGASVRPESVDPLAVEHLRKHLLKGEREQAVWKAADSRLWSHALLIASTFNDDRKVWRQVVQEFVRQEVKTIGSNSESLSALYEIFGGNMEESIDQLVPPSARAGLQMVSRVDSTGPTKNALDGLDRWKETLSLVLNNRIPEDQRALATLGALLGNYGRVQAAHICFLFARNPLLTTMFGGVDEPQASITLLGSDQRAKPSSFHQDCDAVLLTEAYEFAISTLAPAQMSMSLPHLSAYKYQRALDLADNGLKVEAQAYCEAIAAGITSKNKSSPYYHTSLLVEVDELTKRLKQVPVQSTSWIAKPSVEKATSSLLSKLSSFVAGEDSDAESKGSGADVGPFAKTSGSPVLSRSGSQTDLYGSYPGMTPVMPITAASSRYAPGGTVSTRSSSELNRGRSSLDIQRSPPTSSHAYEPRQSMYAPSSTQNKFNQSPARSVSSYQPYGTSPSRSNYQATPPQPSYMPYAATSEPATALQESESTSASYLPAAATGDENLYTSTMTPEIAQMEPQQPSYGGYVPSTQSAPDLAEGQTDQPEHSGYDQPQSYGYGYEPPADTGYVPYEPEPDSDGDDSKKQKAKKKSFMEDDEFSRMPSQTTTKSKPAQNDTASAADRKKANDEAADAAFRAAAEADAQHVKDQAAKKASGGWLGGWFGGKKPDNSLDSPKSGASDAKVFKAKLGEDKMKLYYDKDLKKWVNPDDPDSMKTKATPPPPPPGRSPAPPVAGGPPRMGGTPAPPAISSRASTPASTAGGEAGGLGIGATLPPSVNAGLGLPNKSGTPPPAGAAGSPPTAGALAPPSRPSSNSSTIDDLIGPAGPRKGGKTARGGKKGRYVDVMAQ